jgi:hypothetical protein
LSQLNNAVLNLIDMIIDKCLDVGTFIRSPISEPKQRSNVVETHVEKAAIEYEIETLEVLIGVETIIAGGSSRLRQQTLALVESNRIH